MMTFTALFAFALLPLGTALHAQDVSGTCETPRYVMHMSGEAGGIANTGALLINGTAFRVYEGEPLEWSHYAVTRLPCDGDAPETDMQSGGIVVAGVFHGSTPEDIEADLVPENCNAPVYLLGVNTVTGPEQYRIYATALGDSNIAQRHGFVRLFGRTPDPLLIGAWPDNTSATLSIWPCAEAFDVMYNSDWYQQDILPLRKDSARYRLMTFRPADDP